MQTIVETAESQKQAKAVWNDAEREASIDCIAANPDAADVIPGTDGAPEQIVARRRGRPIGSKQGVTKEAFKIRLDADVIAALRASGDSW